MSHTVGIIGASGYTGSELLRILAGHPNIKVSVVTGDSQAGKEIGEVYPHLAATYRNLTLRKFDEVKGELSGLDLVFFALPHGEAMKIVDLIESPRLVDLGSDFRLTDLSSYKKWYGHDHSAPKEIGKWQYGMTELFREKILASRRVANPGCYPTAAVLALAPLIKEGLLQGPITIDALSGTSGAGRVPSAGLHFSHAFEDARAYKITKHQHTPEIEMAITQFSGKEVKVCFTPHLVPMVRGIHSTASAQVSGKTSVEDLFEVLNAAYKGEKFVQVVSGPIGTKEVRGSNFVQIAPHYDARTGRAVIVSVIDNLVKGAAGQAIQNANLILGHDEGTAISAAPLYP